LAQVYGTHSVTCMNIIKGDLVEVENALGQRHERVALTGVIEGHDFLVVWVAKSEEVTAAEEEGREPQGMPFPVEDVYVRAPA
jgi:hypothetical protein